MTREEAAREIDNLACCFSDKRIRNAMHMGAAALREKQQRQPDPGRMDTAPGFDSIRRTSDERVL